MRPNNFISGQPLLNPVATVLKVPDKSPAPLVMEAGYWISESKLWDKRRVVIVSGSCA